MVSCMYVCTYVCMPWVIDRGLIYWLSWLPLLMGPHYPNRRPSAPSQPCVLLAGFGRWPSHQPNGDHQSNNWMDMAHRHGDYWSIGAAFLEPACHSIIPSPGVGFVVLIIVVILSTIPASKQATRGQKTARARSMHWPIDRRFFAVCRCWFHWSIEKTWEHSGFALSPRHHGGPWKNERTNEEKAFKLENEEKALEREWWVLWNSCRRDTLVVDVRKYTQRESKRGIHRQRNT